MVIIWLVQLVVMAVFDTRKDIFNKLLNLSAMGTSLVITFVWGGVIWLIVPLLLIPVVAGIAGGIFKGLRLRNSKGNE